MFLSVVVPCYNEEKNINIVYCNIKNNLPKYLSGYEIIFVDDGSSDNTVSVIKEKMKSDSFVKLVSLSINSGYGSALRRGFVQAQGDYIAYIDGDGQYDFSDIEVLNRALKQQNAVLAGGVRKKRADRWYRKMLSYLGRKLVFIFFRVNLLDIDCGFKLFKRSLFDTIVLEATSGLIFSLELYLKTRKSGLKFVQQDITHRSRNFGKSKGVNFTQYVLALVDIVKGKLF